MNNRETFTLRSILDSNEFKNCTYELPIVLGKTTVTNEVVIKDLVNLHNILVGGASGQGKTSVLHAMITSLLCKKQSTELQLVLIDPKQCEFDKYASEAKDVLAKIPGVCPPILTDCTDVTLALKGLCDIMDERFKQLEMAGVSNVLEYNAKYKCGDLSKEKGHNFMPYIVVVVDEYGDLMITNGKQIGTLIDRLSSIGWRVGIHLIFSTLRLVYKVINLSIQANFPTRIAFRVASTYESRMITHYPDATELIGNGDMFFVSPDEKIHVQGAFVE